mmetsp:Transcript_23909/g.58431  ORF Transcript_23909/g.58431 Transcript_23909/m.58431 type:complete len:129 (+) Transcript_23909:852-1238(+)
MTKLVPSINFRSTKGWPQIVPCLIFLDPYKETKIGGGRREYNSRYQRPRTKFVLCASKEQLPEIKGAIKDIALNDFNSTVHYEYEETSDEPTTMKAMNGERRKDDATTKVASKNLNKSSDTPYKYGGW